VFTEKDVVTEINGNSLHPSVNQSTNGTLCPAGTDWCLDPSDYPEENILEMTAKQDWLHNLFPVSDGIATRANFGLLDGNLTSDELDKEDDFENVCSTESDYIMPRAAKNKEGKFRFIVNRPKGAEEYVQLVKVVRCLSEGEECGGGSLFGSESTVCRQEYLEHKLVAVGESGEELVIDTFQFPSCCTCNYQHILAF